MRSMSNNVKELISGTDVRFFYLIDIDPVYDVDGRALTVFQHHTNILDGVYMRPDNTFYTDNHGLIHLDPPRMSSTVDRESYKITYADPEFTWRSVFESGIGRTNVSIRVGFFNTKESDMTSGGVTIKPMMPLNHYSDTIVLYQGSTDTPSYSIDANGDASFTLECSSPMGPLGLLKSLSTSRDNLRMRNEIDHSFDQVLTGSKGIDIWWGKDPQVSNT